MVLCRPSGRMQNGTPSQRASMHCVMIASFSASDSTPSRIRLMGSIFRKCRILAAVAFLNTSARATKILGWFEIEWTTSASIRVLEWFGARMMAPSVGILSRFRYSTLR